MSDRLEPRYEWDYCREQKRTRPAHVLIAEKALGKPLPKGVVIHHADCNKKNNTPSNLVICPNEEYHQLLHMRMRAKKECGNPNFRKCCVCKKYDDPGNLYFSEANRSFRHIECWKAYCKNRKLKIKEGKWNPR